MEQQPSNNIFCSRCGAENMRGSNYCHKCGSSLGSSSSAQSQSHSYDSHNHYNNNYSHYSNDSHYNEGLDTGEKVGICLGNICLTPLLGIILYFVWKNDKPKKADDVCTITLLSVFGPFILAFIFTILGF